MLGLVIFSFLCLFSNGICQNYPVLRDGETAKISLLNYNVSNPDGESVEFTYTLVPNSTATIVVTNVPGDAYFVVLQAHSFLQNITLSYDPIVTSKRSVQGTNIGLWQAVSLSNAKFSLFYSNKIENVSIMLAAQAYGNRSPTPGGCNMELPVETAPFLQTAYNSDTVSVEFAAASLPPTVMEWMSSTTSRNCLPSEQHIMYRAHLPERDFTPEMYFLAIQRMMTLGRIKKFAHPVPLKTGAPPLRRIFAAYPGTGSAYVVVARNTSMPVVYVPSLSYACDARFEDNTCAVLTTTFAKIICAVILFVGLFVCLAAHAFFLVETLLLGLLSGGIVFYIMLTNYTTTSEIFLMSVVGGLAFGSSCVLLWQCLSRPVLSVLLATSTLGYFIAAAVFVPIADYVDLVNDVNYWVPYCCVIILVPVNFLFLAEKANFLGTSILGAYASIIPLDYYLGSNLRFILLNSIRRATVPDFKWAIIDIPFQTKDIFLASVLIVLAIAGFFTQSILMKNRPPFPPPSYSQVLRRYRRGRNAMERQPLLRAGHISVS